MGVSKRNPWLSGLGVLLAVLVAFAGLARADVTSDTPGSIVIFRIGVSYPNFKAGTRTFVAFERVKGRPSIAFRLEPADVAEQGSSWIPSGSWNRSVNVPSGFRVTIPQRRRVPPASWPKPNTRATRGKVASPQTVKLGR